MTDDHTKLVERLETGTLQEEAAAVIRSLSEQLERAEAQLKFAEQLRGVEQSRAEKAETERDAAVAEAIERVRQDPTLARGEDGSLRLPNHCALVLAEEWDRLKSIERATKVGNAALWDFLIAARCPNCDGQGWYITQNSHTGEAEQTQCRWCDERKTWLAAAKENT